MNKSNVVHFLLRHIFSTSTCRNLYEEQKSWLQPISKLGAYTKLSG